MMAKIRENMEKHFAKLAPEGIEKIVAISPRTHLTSLAYLWAEWVPNMRMP
jgi:hypothetical protein